MAVDTYYSNPAAVGDWYCGGENFIITIIPVGGIILVHRLVALFIIIRAVVGALAGARRAGVRSRIVGIVSIATGTVLRGSPLTVVLIRGISTISITLGMM